MPSKNPASQAMSKSCHFAPILTACQTCRAHDSIFPEKEALLYRPETAFASIPAHSQRRQKRAVYPAPTAFRAFKTDSASCGFFAPRNAVSVSKAMLSEIQSWKSFILSLTPFVFAQRYFAKAEMASLSPEKTRALMFFGTVRIFLSARGELEAQKILKDRKNRQKKAKRRFIKVFPAFILH